MFRLYHRRLLVCSTNVVNDTFSLKHSPGSRTIRVLTIASGRGSFQRLHRTSRRFASASANERESRVEEETMESDVMEHEGSLHQKPRDVCATEEAMDDESSLNQKSNEVCITEDAVSIDLGVV